MNKLFTKIAAVVLGMTMATGVGVAVASNGKEASSVSAGLNSTPVWSSGTPSYGSSYASGTKTLNGISWYVSCAGNNTSLGWNTSKQGGNNNANVAPLSTISQTTKYGTYQSSGGWKVGKIVVSFSNADSVTGTWYIWYSTNSGSSWTQATTGTLAASTASITYDHGSNIGNSVRFAFGFGTTKTTGTRINISNIQVYEYEDVQTYTVSFAVNTAGYGTVSRSSITNVPSGASITTSNNTVTINGTTVTATPTANTAQYTYSFSNWTKSPNNSTVTSAMTITANFTRTTNTFTVDDSGITNGSLDSTAAIEYGGDLDVNIVPDSGYSVPTSVSVTMGGNDISGDVEYEDGYLYYTPVTGNIVVTAACVVTGTSYPISTTVTNGTYSGDTSITDNGGTASVTISPTGDYKLPTSVSVSGADHTYNSNTGEISLSNASGNVTISAAMVALTEYSITVNETNGSHTGASTIKESRSASLTFKPDSGYGQPASVTVTGATSSWTRGTGVLSLSNPTGNVTVTYAAVGNELDSITISANSGSYTLGDNFVMPTVTAKYTVAADAEVTSSATYSGYDPYTTGSQSVTISYTEGGITKTADYTATVSAASVATITTWNKVTSTADIAVGDVIIIADDTENVALSTEQRTSNRGAAAITKSNDQITWSDQLENKPQQLTLTSTSGITDAPSGSFGLSTGSGYLYAAASGSNHLKTQATNDINGAFVITVSSGAAVISATASSNRPLMRSNYSNNPSIFSCYAANSTTGNGLEIYKKVETQTGSADLIRITASYSGGEKYVGDSISTSDFTVKKQLNTGNELIDVASGYTISANTLTAESNSITVSLTEGNITKTAVVVVPATPRSVTLESVELVQGENVVKEYVDWSGAEWDFTDLTVRRIWSDESTESLSLADLVEAEDASVSPTKPAVGVTSFTVSYEYLEVSITNATVTGISVVADYVESVSWGGKSLSHFKAFSGTELTVATVNNWTVKANYAGAGETSALSFGTGANQFTIRIGDSKSVTSLPYTWVTADDNEFIYVVVGGVAKGDSTNAKANICATINAIDHDETSTGAQSIDLDVANATFDPEGTANTGSEASATINGFTITTDKGYFDAGTSLRVYSGAEFTISSSYTINSVSYTFTGGKTGLAGGTNLDTTEFTETSSAQARVVTIHIEYQGTVTTTTHYANDAEHFDAQKKVVEFAKFMNDTMNGTNVCSGTFANLESAWDDVMDKYDELFGTGTTLNETELAWAKNMLKYATGAWGSEAEAACVEKAMKTYDYCTSKYELDEFLDAGRAAGRAPISPINIINTNSNTIAIIVVISMISATAIGGYFFLRKRKEN